MPAATAEIRADLDTISDGLLLRNDLSSEAIFSLWENSYREIASNPRLYTLEMLFITAETGVSLAYKRGDRASIVKLVDWLMSELGSDTDKVNQSLLTWLRCCQAQSLLIIGLQERSGEVLSSILANGKARKGKAHMIRALICETREMHVSGQIHPGLSEIVRRVVSIITRRKPISRPIGTFDEAFELLSATYVSPIV